LRQKWCDKRLRARGGCLGTCWRRRTVEATKEYGELLTKRWPVCVRMGKPYQSNIW